MKITFLELFIIAMASFRLTRLMVFDKITEFIRAPFFEEEIELNEDGEKEVFFVPKNSPLLKFFGELLSCHWCTGIWSSVAVCLFYFIWPSVATPVLIILAVAAIAAVIETIIQRWLQD